MKYIIVSTDARGGIGYKNDLPWKFLSDITFFYKQTTITKDPHKKNAVIMGRNTWFSIPERNRPLTDRYNIIISSSSVKDQIVFKSVTEAISHIESFDFVENIYFIGGNKIYDEVIRKKLYDGIFLTRVHRVYNCDTFFPDISKINLEEKRCTLKEENGTQLEFQYYSFPVNQEEQLYLDTIKEILEYGNKRMDRTGTGTLSVFGKKMTFDISDGTIPLLTTKKMYFKGIAEELLWFISGDTSAKTLQKKNVSIWNGNSSREYLDSVGLSHLEEGDLGPVYGFQWRHFGAKYKTMYDKYDGKGVDQLIKLIDTLKNNPNDRRMIISAWNPCDFKNMALLPCHILSQFYVSDGKLSCQMYQRSADMGLGVPFNIASYSLFTHMIAQCTGLKPGMFIHIMGDCHVYLNHIEGLTEQMERTPRKFPKLKINSDTTDITKFVYTDFEILDYDPCASIKMDMSA